MFIAFWQKTEQISNRKIDFWQITDTEEGALSVIADIRNMDDTYCFGVGKIEHASEPHWLEINENWGLDK
jgi:hypothetical protein